MEAVAIDRLAADGFAPPERSIDRALDLRYLGQAFELTVPIRPGPLDLDAIAQAFHERHLATYGHADPAGDVELVNVRLAARGVVEKPAPARHAGQGEGGLRSGSRRAWFGGKAVSVDVYDRAQLLPTTMLGGPAIVGEFGATTVVPPGWVARLDEFGDLILERG